MSGGHATFSDAALLEGALLLLPLRVAISMLSASGAFFFLCFTELAVEQVLAISISVLPLSSQSFPEHRSCLVVPPSSVLIPGRSISHPLSQPSNRPKQSETLISDLESRTSSYRIRVKQPTQPLTRGISQLALSSLPDPVGHCVHFCSS